MLALFLAWLCRKCGTAFFTDECFPCGLGAFGDLMFTATKHVVGAKAIYAPTMHEDAATTKGTGGRKQIVDALTAWLGLVALDIARMGMFHDATATASA